MTRSWQRFPKRVRWFGREFAQGGIEKKELGFVVFGWVGV
jgi:hypothetical protein